jgi:hypothetical protein
VHVRMLDYISGGRHDGREWPDPYRGDAVIEVPDWEGEDLIRAHLAARVQPPAPAPPLPGPASAVAAEHGDRAAAEATRHLAAAQAARVPAAAQSLPGRPDVPGVPGQDFAAGAQAAAGGEAGEPGELAEPAAEPSAVADGDPAVAPGPSAPKQAWIDWAVTQGAGPDQAAAMTKADLMSRYGGRL